MKRVYFVYGMLVLLSCFNSSCSPDVQHKNNDSSLVPLHLLKIEDSDLKPKSTIVLDSILYSVEYVPLETNNVSLLGRINEIIISIDHIFILDIEQTESIFIFNRDGQFVNKIFKKGKGPGEYMQPADIAVNEVKKELYLLNEFPSKIIKYNYDGSYIGEIILPFRFSSLTILADGSFALINEAYFRKYGNPAGIVNNIASNLYFVTPNEDSFQGGGSLETAFEENMISNRYYGLMKNTDIIYHPMFNDTIFGLEEFKYYPLLAIDFGQNSIDISDVAGLDKIHFLDYCATNNIYYISGQYCHTKNFLIFYVRSVAEDVAYLSIFNRYNGEHMSFASWNSTLYNPCNLIPRTSWKDYFVSIISPRVLLRTKYATETEYENLENNLLQFTPSQDILSRIDENSNPVLAFYKLRPEKINMESVYMEGE